jgi:hypothetical protein
LVSFGNIIWLLSFGMFVIVQDVFNNVTFTLFLDIVGSSLYPKFMVLNLKHC